MENDFIIKWRRLSRNERKKIIHDFITTRKMQAKATVKKSLGRPDVRRSVRRSVNRRKVVFNNYRFARAIKPIFAFSSSSPSDPAGGGDDISGPGEQDSPTSKKSSEDQPSGRRPLKPKDNADRKTTRDSAAIRQRQREKLVEFINLLRLKTQEEEARRRQARQMVLAAR
ncbi:MAG: hypothetical protein NC830_07460, partial [Candidatus Omnitrophica bacterium]|nr:hypothetical protein [Candidatus Omnitrophota bacterium]